MRGLALVLAGLALLGCKPPRGPGGHSPAPGEPLLPHSKPDDCVKNLAGSWHDTEDDTFHYRVRDDGKKVTIEPFRAPGVGVDHAEQKGTRMTIELERRPYQLVGVTRETAAFTFPGVGQKQCAFELRTRIVICEEDPSGLRLVVESEQTTALKPDCSRASDEVIDVAQHEWRRDRT
jgi:hypothetical protein